MNIMNEKDTKNQKLQVVPKAGEKPVELTQRQIYEKKLATVQQRLKAMDLEISEKEKKNEPVGILPKQRRSLRSWEVRFQRKLKEAS